MSVIPGGTLPEALRLTQTADTAARAVRAVEAIVRGISLVSAGSEIMSPEYRLHLELAGETLQVESKHPFPEGTRLLLRALSADRVRVEQILNEPGRRTEHVLRDALRTILPRQAPLARTLLHLHRAAFDSRVPLEVREVIQSLLRSVPRGDTLMSSTGLRRAIADSGIYAENKLIPRQARTAAANGSAAPDKPSRASNISARNPRQRAFSSRWAPLQRTLDRLLRSPLSTSLLNELATGRTSDGSPTQTRSPQTPQNPTHADSRPNVATTPAQADRAAESSRPNPPPRAPANTDAKTPGSNRATRPRSTAANTGAGPARRSTKGLAQNAAAARSAMPGNESKSSSTGRTRSRDPTGQTATPRRYGRQLEAQLLRRNPTFTSPGTAKTASNVRLTGKSSRRTIYPAAQPAIRTGHQSKLAPRAAGTPQPRSIEKAETMRRPVQDVSAPLGTRPRHQGSAAGYPSDAEGSDATPRGRAARFGLSEHAIQPQANAAKPTAATQHAHPVDGGHVPEHMANSRQARTQTRTANAAQLSAPDPGKPSAPPVTRQNPASTVPNGPGPQSAAAPDRGPQAGSRAAEQSILNAPNTARATVQGDDTSRSATSRNPSVTPPSNAAKGTAPDNRSLPADLLNLPRVTESFAPADATPALNSDLKLQISRALARLTASLAPQPEAAGPGSRQEASTAPASAGRSETPPLYSSRGLLSGATDISARSRHAATNHGTEAGGHRVLPQSAARGITAQLVDQLEAALARTRLHQFVALAEPAAQHTDNSASPVNVEIPIARDQHFDNLRLRIDAEEDRTEDKKIGRIWQVRLCLDIAELGPLHVHLMLAGHALAATLWAERQSTLDSVQAELFQLEEAFAELGVSLQRLECRPGRPVNERHVLFGPLLDIRT